MSQPRITAGERRGLLLLIALLVLVTLFLCRHRFTSGDDPRDADAMSEAREAVSQVDSVRSVVPDAAADDSLTHRGKRGKKATCNTSKAMRDSSNIKRSRKPVMTSPPRSPRDERVD